MIEVSLAEAKARFGTLVDRARSEETVNITRRGKPVARLIPAEPPRQKVDATKLRALTDRMRLQSQALADFISRMRDDTRY